jgi:predicted DsbA family dithiol-disulfide isomerase
MTAKVELVHLSSPACQWSWGYEPIVNRVEAVYGRQVRVTVGQAVPYVERARWLEDYGMTSDEAVAWMRDVVRQVRLPCWTAASWEENVASCLPAALAVKSAGLVHGPAAERRLARHLMNALYVERRDIADDKVLASVVESLGLDNARMVDVAQTGAPRDALGEDAARAGHGANFYSLLVRDAREAGGTTVALEHAYDPARVERAIEFVAGRPLRRTPPKLSGLLGYVEDHGLVSLPEIQSMYGVDRARAKKALDRLTRAGELAALRYPATGGATFWSVA